MLKLTRISYNSSGWKRPTGDAREHEAVGTYNHTNGYGHEDWLFRDEWEIDSWRYALIEGVSKSFTKLAREAQPIDITLFTIEPDRRRRYVATLSAVECLNDHQAEDSLDQFKRLGWFEVMRQEILAVGGKVQAFDAPARARHILNVRFRLKNVIPFAPATFAVPEDPVSKLGRYRLCDDANIGLAAAVRSAERQGSTELPVPKSFKRRSTSAIVCTPEHARMQGKLMQILQIKYPGANILREKDFVDVSVETDAELLLFEIKCDLEPRTVIRNALGQILEYAYHPTRSHALPVRLIIVGRNPLGKGEQDYIDRLTSTFKLPLEYLAVPI